MKKHTLNLTRQQVIDSLAFIQDSGAGRSSLMQMMLEALMRSERDEYNTQNGDVSNGYRPRRAYSEGQVFELQVPRTRYGNFKPVLLSVLKDQDEEMSRLCHTLYTKGLTTEQVGEVFGEIYGHHYSKQSISRMASATKEELMGWLERPLDAYYPIVYVDCTFVPVRRDGSVSKEAFYTLLGVRADASREVLSIVNLPTESATGWEETFVDLRMRGVERVDMFISDGVSGIENATARQFPKCDHQLCAAHLKRSLLNKVRAEKRSELADDLKEVFQIMNKFWTQEDAMTAWKALCAKWSKSYPSFGPLGQKDRYQFYFTVLKLPPNVRRMTWTTNWVERLNRDYKRVLRMRGAMPNAKSVLALLASAAIQKRTYDTPIHQLKEADSFDWI
jgi:transposase-like protein